MYNHNIEWVVCTATFKRTAANGAGIMTFSFPVATSGPTYNFSKVHEALSTAKGKLDFTIDRLGFLYRSLLLRCLDRPVNGPILSLGYSDTLQIRFSSIELTFHTFRKGYEEGIFAICFSPNRLMAFYHFSCCLDVLFHIYLNRPKIRNCQKNTGNKLMRREE